MKFYRNRPDYFWLASCAITILASVVFGQDLYTESQLMAMNDEQLEKICTDRGFALVLDEVDPATGETYQFSHDDYVTAAQQCLAIEKEMNELLNEHPELAAELEAEINKMQAELETQQQEVDNLQEKISETENILADASSSATDNAFDPPSQEGGSEANDKAPIGGGSDETGSDENGGTADILDGHSSSRLEEETVDDTSMPANSTDGETIKQDLPATNAGDEKKASDGTEVPKEMEQRGKEGSVDGNEDFSMNGMTIEIIKGLFRQAGDDLKRIVEMVTPILQSMVRAGDVAVRHIRALIAALQKQYENARRDESNNDGQKEATA